MKGRLKTRDRLAKVELLQILTVSSMEIGQRATHTFFALVFTVAISCTKSKCDVASKASIQTFKMYSNGLQGAKLADLGKP